MTRFPLRPALLAAALLAVGWAAAPLAAAEPAATTAPAPTRAHDPRLASRPYNPSEVVRIEGKAGVQATIAFADNEQIENVAIGDSAAWQVTPNKRATMLFVKPLSGNARTNLTVITDRRSYYFDLVAAPSAQPLYVLRFTYPDDAKKAQAAASPTAAKPRGSSGEALALAGPTANEAATPVAPAAAAIPDPAKLNFAWRSKGKRKLLPARVFDDGSSTYLRWSAGSAMPAILIRDASGAEGAVNFAVRDDVVVIEGVPPLLILRSGNDAALLENRGPPRPPATTAPPRAPVAAPTVVATAAPASSVTIQPAPASSQDN